MALPVAHVALALGITRFQQLRLLLFLAAVALAPDFDFALVWGLGLPVSVFHRTFSHSLVAAGLVALVFQLVVKRVAARKASQSSFCLQLASISVWLVLLVFLSHPLLDMLCTADAADHGVMLFWPFSEVRLGWPLLVPIYAWFAETPFTPLGALSFTALEVVLAYPFWLSGRLLRRFASPARRNRLG